MQIQYYDIVYTYLYIYTYISWDRAAVFVSVWPNLAIKRSTVEGGRTTYIGIQTIYYYAILLHLLYLYTSAYAMRLFSRWQRDRCAWDPAGRGPDDERFAHAQASVCGGKAAGRANFSVSVIPVLLSNKHRFHGCTLNT